MTDKASRERRLNRIFAGIVGQTVLLFLWGFVGLALLVILLSINEIEAIPLQPGAFVLLVLFAIVCFSLAKIRINARREKEYRYIEQIDHLAELEEKIKQ